jgi:hypothetical protein
MGSFIDTRMSLPEDLPIKAKRPPGFVRIVDLMQVSDSA